MPSPPSTHKEQSLASLSYTETITLGVGFRGWDIFLASSEGFDSELEKWNTRNMNWSARLKSQGAPSLRALALASWLKTGNAEWQKSLI